ncbi:MAG TPA: DUF362 domain-containing protein [Nitrospirota bacterium]|nr:DUF362 domain-containing protein [Nitrospirota bacterium]
MSRVSLIKGDDRRTIAKRSLDLIADDIKRGIGSRQPVIKPNFVSSTIQLASSHVDQMRGILDFLSSIYRGKIIIAEAACYDTKEAFKNFGYMQLLKEYNVELIDLNNGPYEIYSIIDRHNEKIAVKLSRPLLDKGNYIISAAKLKTHDSVVVTLSVKNMAVGCILGKDKKAVHQGVRQTNLIIAGLAGHLRMDLAVIDGFEGMEGDGPTSGNPVHPGLGIASIDALSADRVACEVMGVHFHDVGYLHYCAEQGMGEADLNRIEVLGERLGDCVRPFKLHQSVDEQYTWKHET